MAEILYTYKNQVYANITNKCNCRCRFCIRNQEDGIGDADTLWHRTDPSCEDIQNAMDSFDFTGFTELVYCGYGEPTCALDTLINTAQYAKERFGLSIRVNTNGLGSLYHGKDIVPQLAEVVDSVSISLNAPDAQKYNEVTRPVSEHAFEGMLKFASQCKKYLSSVKLSIVDVLSEDDIRSCQQLADRLGIPLRIRKFSS